MMMLLNVQSLFQLPQHMEEAVLYRLCFKHNYPIQLHDKHDFYLYRHNIQIKNGIIQDEKQVLFFILAEDERCRCISRFK